MKDLNWIAEEQWKKMNQVLQFDGTAEECEAALERLAHRFPKFCSWCEAEGKTVQTGWSSVANSSGICERHRAELREEIHEI